MTAEERYTEKPLLRLLDCYVLMTIGELTLEQHTALEAMVPKLSTALGHSGNWHEIITAAVDMGEWRVERIRASWRSFREHELRSGGSASPHAFAHCVADDVMGLNQSVD